MILTTSGGFHKWGYPCSSSISRWDFPELKHPFWGTPIYGNPHLFWLWTAYQSQPLTPGWPPVWSHGGGGAANSGSQWMRRLQGIWSDDCTWNKYWLDYIYIYMRSTILFLDIHGYWMLRMVNDDHWWLEYWLIMMISVSKVIHSNTEPAMDGLYRPWQTWGWFTVAWWIVDVWHHVPPRIVIPFE